MRKFIAVATIFIASAIQAQQPANADSFYAGAQAGITVLPDLDVTQFGLTEKLATDVGFNIGGVAGYNWTAQRIRVEGELSYRRNGNDTLVGVPVDGNVSSFSFMANVWYDVNTNSNWVPYLGGGVGIAIVSADVSIFGISLLDDSDTVFAYQIGAGLGYDLGNNLFVSADYRWLATADAQLNDAGGFPLDAEYSSHNFMVSVRKHF